jgi:FkbM family methyltransferase
MRKTRVKHLVDRHLPSAARVYRKIRDEHWFAGLKEVRTSIGLTLIAEPRLATAILESNEIPTLEALVVDRDVFVDVGANLGLYSCVVAKTGKYVIAVEPHPLNLRLLYRNFQRNGLDRNFEIHAAALGDRQRIAGLFGGQQGGSLLEGWSGIRSNYETTVFVNTLDHLLEGRFLDQRLLIKVDVEGNEYSLLVGASETLGRNPAPIWMVEIGVTENFGGATNPHLFDVFETFWSHGYRANPLARPDQVVDRADLERWVRDRKTDHGDINYRFVKTESSEYIDKPEPDPKGSCDAPLLRL